MSEELKPCPFCGGGAKAHTYKDDFEATRFSVECVSCPAEMGWLADAQPWGENLATKRAETIAAWNRRAPSPDMREAVEALTMLIYEITHLSAEDDKGLHHCYISKDALESARAALRSLTGAKP